MERTRCFGGMLSLVMIVICMLPLKVWRVASFPSIGVSISIFTILRFHFGKLGRSVRSAKIASGVCFSVVVRVCVWCAGMESAYRYAATATTMRIRIIRNKIFMADVWQVLMDAASEKVVGHCHLEVRRRRGTSHRN